MSTFGASVAGCAFAFLGGAFLIDTPSKFLIGLVVMLGVATFAAALHEVTK